MNGTTEKNTEPASLGERLKNARMKRKITLQAAAQTTRIRSVYLDALENNRWEELPAEVYLVGFLKKYAQFLNLSPDGIAELYARGKASANAENGSPPPSAAEPETTPARDFPVRPSLIFLAVLTILAALLVFPQRHFMARRQKQDMIPPLPVSEHTLSVTALRDTWLNVSTNNGRHLFRGIIPAANIRVWKSRAPFRLEVRKTADVRVELDGAAVNLEGQDGRKIALPAKP